ncbi:MAG: BlaI/MecI/CopY family transcriptional regulator [Pirellulales bacterium]
MNRTSTNVTDAELRLLAALWEGQPQTARQLAEALYRAAGATELGTVQKLLQRLETKGLVQRDRSGHVHQFSPAVGRDELAGRQLQQMAEKLSEGSLVPLISHLVKTRAISAREKEEIRRLLDEKAPKKPKR